MDLPVKSRVTKPIPTRKISEVPKIDAKGAQLIHREKRVFGTARNPNIPMKKTAPEKPPMVKPASALLKKAAKPSQAIRSSRVFQPPVAEVKAKVKAKKSSLKTPVRLKKKSVFFQENKMERNVKSLGDINASEPQTPLNAVIPKPKVITPYHSAEKCSKCRFDKLETSSYWLSQIKLAESVGKHAVSAAFFGLAFECNAEPIRNLRIEVKKYLARHDHLKEEVEWRKLSVSYGVVKKGVEAVVEEANARIHSHNEEHLPIQSVEENKR